MENNVKWLHLGIFILLAAVMADCRGCAKNASSQDKDAGIEVEQEVDDDKLGLVASYDLNPQKARILLSVALLKPRNLDEIQNLFYQY